MGKSSLIIVGAGLLVLGFLLMSGLVDFLGVLMVIGGVLVLAAGIFSALRGKG